MCKLITPATRACSGWPYTLEEAWPLSFPRLFPCQMRLRGPVATCPWGKEGLRLSPATAWAAKQHEGAKQAFAYMGRFSF